MRHLRVVRLLLVAAACGGVLPGTSLAEAPALDPGQRAFFENRIRPLLVEHCLGCHGSQKDGETAPLTGGRGLPKGGLRLDSRAGLLRGGDNGAAFVPGRPDESLLIAAVRYQNADLQMPPEGKLSQPEIDALVRWVQMGAPDPRQEVAEESAAASDSFDLAARRAAHWSWQPLADPEPPRIADSGWARDGLDRFIKARLDQAGLEPAPEADRRAWLRRVTFGLIGLPPTPEEIEAFLEDETQEAHARVVDRLLASPHFGETWGQHWLDLVRFAESYGHEGDSLIAEAYRYRDYVVQAFNEDVPYDQLVAEHVAGDLLEEPRLDPADRTNQSIQGTGFWHLGDASHAPVDVRGDESDRVANQIDAFSKTFIGLSMTCARCHDHKFDAISTRDYYAFFGFLQSSSRQYADISDPLQRRRAATALVAVADAHRPRVLSAFRALKVAQLRELARYLEAALEISNYAALFDRAEREGLEEITLERVVAHLGIAREDAHHPFHALSLLEDTGTLTSIDERKAVVLRRWQELAGGDGGLGSLQVVSSTKKGERNYESQTRPWQSSDLVIDYSKLAPECWVTNGDRFGDGPLPAGRALLGGADAPIHGFLGAGAAVSRVALEGCSGFLRTQTFGITSDRLWYQVRGSAEVFLAIDSYRLVAGPLHRVVKKRLSGSFDGWRWESQHLRDYYGHRGHIEFRPSGDFAVRRVLFAETPPPEPFEAPEQLLESVLGADDLAAGTLARRLADALIAVVEGVGPDGIGADGLDAESSNVAGRARLLDWILQNERVLPSRIVPETPSWTELSDALHSAQQAYTEARIAATKLVPAKQVALALLDGTGEDEPVHIRGNHKTRAPDPVPRRFLEAIVGADAKVASAGSGRLELSRTLTDGSTPLVPRVVVNRIWYHLFGRGIVATVDDFGFMGAKPSHPELLDALSSRFVAGGWSIKGLIRDVVLSSTYRMSSRPDARGRDRDPENILLHRMPIRRLGAEAIRDHVLAVSGRLERKIGGPSVAVFIDQQVRNGRSPSEQGPVDGAGRRSIYLQVRRNHVSSMLVAFDRPIPIFSRGKRSVSNAPAQPLILLNDPFVHEQADLWATGLLTEKGRTAEARLRDAYVTAYARPATAEEFEAAAAFLAEQAAVYAESGEEDTQKRAWTDLCHTLMNVKEFFYVN